MKAHTYYIIFGRPPIGGSFPLPPLAAPLPLAECNGRNVDVTEVGLPTGNI